LVVLSNLPAQVGARGGLVLTQKFVNGVAEYAKTWPGRVAALVRLSDTRSSDMDHVEVMPDQLPFALELRPTATEEMERRLRNAAAVLAFLCPAEAPTATLCRRIETPLVYVSEYSLKTEWQIIDAQTSNPLLRWRRKQWAASAERARIAALRQATGIQCSGTPTYDIYRHVNPNAMLFFDSRVRQRDVIDEAALATKAAALLERRPLRLVFGGRLISMKGVRDLPLVARELMRRAVPFTMDIYGRGVLEEQLLRDIDKLGLRGRVALRGSLDFDTGWVPLLKRRADLFVCCHPQGDPSSTYPEVMACGVPIAGYDNDAFAGIVEHSGAGWLSPMNEPDKLAAVIARLHRYRGEIAEAAERSRRFAIDHCFELTFGARVRHILALSRKPQVAGAAAPVIAAA
jgi:glycosyltransferase involved in cell wall biosynthesis